MKYSFKYGAGRVSGAGVIHRRPQCRYPCRDGLERADVPRELDDSRDIAPPWHALRAVAVRPAAVIIDQARRLPATGHTERTLDGS
jgi:hypothetical protein